MHPATTGTHERAAAASDDGYGVHKATGPFLLSLQSSAEIYRRSTTGKTAPDVYIRPTTTHVFFLTRIGGPYSNGGAIAVHHNNTDAATRCNTSTTESLPPLTVGADDTAGVWKLGGCESGRSSLTAEATCIPGSNFIVDPGGVVIGSASFSAQTTSCSAPQSGNMWPGVAASFLSGVSGVFMGGGEVAEIVKSTSLQASSQVRAQSHSCDYPFVSDSGYSMFVGGPLPGNFTHTIESILRW